MYSAFMKAFSDYPSFNSLSHNQFIQRFLNKLNLNSQLSGGAFHQRQLVGFVYSRLNHYQNKYTAYNGGTGVIPDYRGMGITGKIYQHLLPQFKDAGVQQGVLEVLTINQPALKVYQKIGFKINKLYRCYKLKKSHFKLPEVPDKLQLKLTSAPCWEQWAEMSEYEPSFLDQTINLRQNLSHEKVLEAFWENKRAGYIIFQPANGRISQLAVHPDFRRQGIATLLIYQVFQNIQNQELTLINVDESAVKLQKFLLAIGFNNVINQYEMVLPLH
ncbi:MAG: GNAT family N-acetyltransferase [Candidatus Cyclobacteriaceae bacterium M3_2C_046]